MIAPRTCAWCRSQLALTARGDARFCGKVCRQAAFRLRRQQATGAAHGQPLIMAYADPPYPGRARRFYGCPEVDHAALVAELERIAPGGWALSTAADALHQVLPLCPPGARVCAWVKPIAPARRTNGLHNTWEPLIVVRGRQKPPGVRDWLRAQPARGGGDLPGRKPLAFCAWLFACLGLEPGDTLIDLFPGTGIIGRAWAELSPEDLRDAAGGKNSSFCEVSPAPGQDAELSPAPGQDAELSPGALNDGPLWASPTTFEALSDTSPEEGPC